MRDTVQPGGTTCGNCGAATSGAYCSGCGQDTRPEPPTVAEYFHELLDHFIHFDGKLSRTLVPLLFVPGKVPHDYLANKRERYVKPLKLYLAAIAFAFAAFQFLGWDLGLRFGGPSGFHLNFDLLSQAPAPTTVARGRLSADSVPWVLEHVDTPGIRRIKALPPDEQLNVARERGIHNLPYLTLVLVPLYAVLLQWVYRNRHLRYAAHLVFALYGHSFLLLICIIEARLPLALATLLSMWAIVYYVLSLKRVYGGTWWETLGRGTLLATMCFVAFVGIGLLATVVLLSV